MVCTAIPPNSYRFFCRLRRFHYIRGNGYFRFLTNRNYTFLDKLNPTLSKEEKHKLYLENFSVNTFITGSNAITMDGKIFNIDGNGSRVAPMLYGPKQVIIVVDFNYYE
ncbi:LUD domain-containing protein [Acetobacterium carbinolicum]|uniref:LUD domain-containing protein n=1 Tax=Acetobacterium carbinolicum TaxID=52690 RepID=UPI0039BFE62D